MPRKKLGQHFLIKGSILERIAAAACPVPADLVIEIGPGRGALTEKLLKRAARVIALEIDPYLAAHVRQRFAGDPRLEVVEGDVLATDLSQWGPAAIAGNLPYYITSPILERTARRNFTRAVFLIQREVAQRLVAGPGTRDYGFLTVQTALFASVRRLFDVKPSAFHPPPKVDSSVVLLEPRHADLGIADADAFVGFIGRCFHHKRKTIRNNLVETYGKEAIDRWPEAALRAEQISLEGFAEMYRRLPLSPYQRLNDQHDGEANRRGNHLHRGPRP
ncbi:MAG: 16S rRNA (adenine(1518)-N(6)/adenine(1519)-N(6))-dimethyltransferase RsmA [Acidobacteriia bacterium]|nr:16S rRNA (adenine(1518)-N(6)/adenine(1519)-N(6))-dimethyltransferase RsmA [Terriglobia bacterium]